MAAVYTAVHLVQLVFGIRNECQTVRSAGRNRFTMIDIGASEKIKFSFFHIQITTQIIPAPFIDAGAYGSVLGSNYNTRGRGAEVLVNGARTRVIRRRESFEDLTARDVR